MSPPIDRRRFLATSALAGAALATQRRTTAEDTDANAKVVVGLMGTGGRGGSLIRALEAQPNVAVAYVCDVNSNLARQAAQDADKRTGKAPTAVTDFRRILDDKAVDALVIATPNHWHAPATILACTAGKHAYVEKPCSHNPREGELMVAAARKNKRHVQMGTQRRSCPHIVEAMEKIHDGELGRVYLAQSWYTNVRKSIGHGEPADVPEYLDFDLWQGPAPRKPYNTKILPYFWHWFWHWGNGELGNNGVHFLDLCRWGLQADYPIRVTSSGGHYRYQDDQETPDTHTVAFEFDGNKMATWEGLSCSQHSDLRGALGHVFLEFHGENGSLAISDKGYSLHDPRGKEIPGKGGKADEKDFYNVINAAHMANFIGTIRGNDDLHAEIEEGHKSTLLCHLGNIAHRTGQSLRCQPANGTIVGNAEASQFWSREYEQGWEPKV